MSATASKVAKGKDVQKRPIHYPFWHGGSASCFAACITHPLDLSTRTLKPGSVFDQTANANKVRLQTQPHNGPRKSMVQMFVHVFKTDSFRGLYRGLSASLLRQMTYSTTRFGVYEELKQVYTSARTAPSLPSLIAMASTSGLLGGIAGNPADVLNVRMQHDAALPEAQRRHYRHAVDGLVRMVREEGWQALWRGVWPNSARAVLMTASQLASYDAFKRSLLARTSMQDDLRTHFTASFLAGFVATTVCSPVDVIKTRIMSATEGERRSIRKLLADTFRREGWTWMFKGWVPSFVRLGPHTIATFLFLEQHKKVYRRLHNL